MQIKRTVYAIMIFCTMTMLVSCGTGKRELKESGNATSVKYEKSTQDISGIVKNGFFTMLVWKDDIVISEKDDKENYIYHYINRDSWKEENRIEISAAEANGNATGVSIDDTGNLYMLRVDGHTAAGNKAAIYVLKYFVDENKHIEQDVTDLITQVKWEGDGISGLVSVIAIEGDRLAVITDYQVIVLDKELKSAEYILSDNKIVSAAKMKDGDIICISENDTETLFCRLDVSKKKWKDSADVVKGGQEGAAVLDGVAYDFYYRNAKGIFGIDWKERQYTQIIDYSNMNIDKEGGEDSYMRPLSDGTMITQNMKDCITSGKAELQMYISE